MKAYEKSEYLTRWQNVQSYVRHMARNIADMQAIAVGNRDALARLWDIERDLADLAEKAANLRNV